MVDLSIVLPAYNESASIARSLSRLSRYLDSVVAEGGRWASWEILVVDDGSGDWTFDAARESAASEPRIRVHRLDQNRGKGAAIKKGIGLSVGRLVITTDVDLSYGLEDIAVMADALGADSGFDMVTGDRRHPDSRLNLALSALAHVTRRQILSAVFNAVARLFFALPWRDTQCGLKGFRREAARMIVGRTRTEGFLTDIEMFVIADALGLAVGTIPVHLTYLSVDSTVDVFRQVSRVFRDAWTIKAAQFHRVYATPPARPD